MVSDDDGGSWDKRQFLFYYNGRFYCELVDISIGDGEYIYHGNKPDCLRRGNEMTNYDKYKDEILKLAKEQYSDLYTAEMLAIRDISGLVDANNVIKWLFDEYEPPLLKNGDGLKPGDWIMVSDDDGSVTWYKNRFVCHYNATFFVIDDSGNDSFNENGTNITGWKYARLPEDGE